MAMRLLVILLIAYEAAAMNNNQYAQGLPALNAAERAVFESTQIGSLKLPESPVEGEPLATLVQLTEDQSRKIAAQVSDQFRSLYQGPTEAATNDPFAGPPSRCPSLDEIIPAEDKEAAAKLTEHQLEQTLQKVTLQPQLSKLLATLQQQLVQSTVANPVPSTKDIVSHSNWGTLRENYWRTQQRLQSSPTTALNPAAMYLNQLVLPETLPVPSPTEEFRRNDMPESQGHRYGTQLKTKTAEEFLDERMQTFASRQYVPIAPKPPTTSISGVSTSPPLTHLLPVQQQLPHQRATHPAYQPQGASCQQAICQNPQGPQAAISQRSNVRQPEQFVASSPKQHIVQQPLMQSQALQQQQPSTYNWSHPLKQDIHNLQRQRQIQEEALKQQQALLQLELLTRQKMVLQPLQAPHLPQSPLGVRLPPQQLNQELQKLRATQDAEPRALNPGANVNILTQYLMLLQRHRAQQAIMGADRRSTRSLQVNGSDLDSLQNLQYSVNRDESTLESLPVPDNHVGICTDLTASIGLLSPSNLPEEVRRGAGIAGLARSDATVEDKNVSSVEAKVKDEKGVEEKDQEELAWVRDAEEAKNSLPEDKRKIPLPANKPFGKSRRDEMSSIRKNPSPVEQMKLSQTQTTTSATRQEKRSEEPNSSVRNVRRTEAGRKVPKDDEFVVNSPSGPKKGVMSKKAQPVHYSMIQSHCVDPSTGQMRTQRVQEKPVHSVTEQKRRTDPRTQERKASSLQSSQPTPRQRQPAQQSAQPVAAPTLNSKAAEVKKRTRSQAQTPPAPIQTRQCSTNVEIKISSPRPKRQKTEHVVREAEDNDMKEEIVPKRSLRQRKAVNYNEFELGDELTPKMRTASPATKVLVQLTNLFKDIKENSSNNITTQMIALVKFCRRIAPQVRNFDQQDLSKIRAMLWAAICQLNVSSNLFEHSIWNFKEFELQIDDLPLLYGKLIELKVLFGPEDRSLLRKLTTELLNGESATVRRDRLKTILFFMADELILNIKLPINMMAVFADLCRKIDSMTELNLWLNLMNGHTIETVQAVLKHPILQDSQASFQKMMTKLVSEENSDGIPHVQFLFGFLDIYANECMLENGPLDRNVGRSLAEIHTYVESIGLNILMFKDAFAMAQAENKSKVARLLVSMAFSALHGQPNHYRAGGSLTSLFVDLGEHITTNAESPIKAVVAELLGTSDFLTLVDMVLNAFPEVLDLGKARILANLLHFWLHKESLLSEEIKVHIRETLKSQYKRHLEMARITPNDLVRLHPSIRKSKFSLLALLTIQVLLPDSLVFDKHVVDIFKTLWGIFVAGVANKPDFEPFVQSARTLFQSSIMFNLLKSAFGCSEQAFVLALRFYEMGETFALFIKFIGLDPLPVFPQLILWLGSQISPDLDDKDVPIISEQVTRVIEILGLETIGRIAHTL